MARSSSDSARIHRQEGVTIPELVIGMVIVIILSSVVMAGFSKVKRNARDGAMRVAAAKVDASFVVFNRMYPVFGVATDPLSHPTDELITRIGSAGIVASGTAATGYFTPMGDELLKTWPDNPYTGMTDTKVRIRGYAGTVADPCPTAAAPLAAGQIAICRDAANPGGWTLLYFGKNASGQNVLLGTRKNGMPQ